MPSALTHPAVPLALGLALGSRLVPPRLLLVGVLAAVAPDLDVLTFKLGIPYAHPLGHRGASHSLSAAFLLGLLAFVAAPVLCCKRLAALVFVFVSYASHGLLDMLTNGGHGVGLWWPFDTERVWFPWHPIEVSPIGVKRFLSAAGAKVLLSELLWIWFRAGVAGLILHFARHFKTLRPR